MSTISQINIPDLGDVDEVEVIEVCVEVGQKVESEDSIMILETDKAAMEIPASVNGEVKNILINVGDMVKQGMPFVEIKTIKKAKKLFKKQRNIPWHRNVRIMINQMNNFSKYPRNFSNLWLENNMKLIYETYEKSVFSTASSQK